MVANLPTRTIRQYCHTLSIFFSIAWYIVVSNLHRLESNYYCPYMYRILLMWKQQPEMYHLLNPVSLCVEVMARSKMPSWSLNVHPFTKVPVQDILLVLFASFFVFNVHYPEGPASVRARFANTVNPATYQGHDTLKSFRPTASHY